MMAQVMAWSVKHKRWYDISDFYSTLPFLKSFIINGDICNDLKDDKDIMRQVRVCIQVETCWYIHLNLL